MTILVTILHVLVCGFLILVILLQQGRGGGLGAAFGGASQQVFGGAGAGNFLTKLTEIAAFTFMFTSLLLAGLATNRGPSKYEEAAKVIYAGPATPASASTAAPPPAMSLPIMPPSIPTGTTPSEPSSSPAPALPGMSASASPSASAPAPAPSASASH
jgi:preprotein translocase subunit SecG